MSDTFFAVLPQVLGIVMWLALVLIQRKVAGQQVKEIVEREARLARQVQELNDREVRMNRARNASEAIQFSFINASGIPVRVIVETSAVAGQSAAVTDSILLPGNRCNLDNLSVRRMFVTIADARITEQPSWILAPKEDDDEPQAPTPEPEPFRAPRRE